MFKNCIVILWILLLTAISGCSQVRTISKQYQLDSESNKGVIILSTTETGEHLSSDLVLNYPHQLYEGEHSDDEENQSIIEDIVDGAFDKLLNVEQDAPEHEYSDLGSYLGSNTFYCLRYKECGQHDKNYKIEMWDDCFIDTGKEFRSVENGKSIPEGRYIGKLNAIELPAGNYKFYKYVIETVHTNTKHRYYYDSEGKCIYNNDSESYTEYFQPVKLFLWTFHVEPGIAKYLGNVNVHHYFAEDCINSKSFGGLCSKITINNEQYRDLKIVADKYENLVIEDIKTEILQDNSENVASH